MKNTREMTNLISTTRSFLECEEENVCPICKSRISPIYISSSLNKSDAASIFNHCCSCHNSFISNYKLKKLDKGTQTHYYAGTLLSSEPCRFDKHIFDINIITLSPQFDKIYNQALAAETQGLDEIAGLGYRKSLEFLTKDFAIHLHPEAEDEIKRLPLSQCIKKYIENPQIQTLTERSSWIGNDEAHYIRKQETRDVSDMKSFIQATVYFICMVLITEDAASIVPVK